MEENKGYDNVINNTNVHYFINTLNDSKRLHNDTSTTAYLDLTTLETVILSSYLAVLSVFGITANLTVIFLFCTVKTLRTPMNVLFINLTATDLLACTFGTLLCCMHVILRTKMSPIMCRLYGFSTFLGAVTWVAALIVAGLPLVGLGTYTHEGIGLWCAIEWQDATKLGKIYIASIFVVVYFIPIAIITFSYTKVIFAIKEIVEKGTSKQCINAEKAVTRQTIVMVTAFLVAWTPYAVLCMAKTLGVFSVSSKFALTPSLFAKSSFIWNPVIYVGMNKQFQTAFLAKIGRSKTPGKPVRPREEPKSKPRCAILSSLSATIDKDCSLLAKPHSYLLAKPDSHARMPVASEERELQSIVHCTVRDVGDVEC